MNWLALLVLSTVLAACGGGGGDPTIDGGKGGATTGGVAATVTVSLLNSADQPASTLSSTAPLTAKALVIDKNGAPVSNTIVTFASDATLVSLSSTNGTALTDAKGYASITVSALNATVTGAGKLTATVAAGTAMVTGEASYEIKTAQASGAKMTLSLLNGNNASNALSSATPLTAKAIVTDLSGKPISGALVMFSTDSALALLSSSIGTALTDDSGIASVILRPVSLLASGAGTLRATTTTNGATANSQASYSLGATELFASNLTFLPNSIAAYGSTTMSVDIYSGDILTGGTPYLGPGATVRFSSPCILAGKASVATDVAASNGKATVVYRDLGCSNTDKINASVVGSNSAAHSSLSVGSPAPASIQLSAVSPAGKSIVIKGQGGLLRTETATLTFRVFDTFNKPLAGQDVTFSLDDGAAVTLNKLMDTTDANGEVITTVNSGTTPTTFRVKAALKSSTYMNTYSDSILVTTGKPVQSGFSISVGKSNVEGWSYDSSLSTPATTVTVLLADQAGNPVPDGTPVAFQSSLGAIGSSSMGGCITSNGGCSVDFRSQEPRTASNPPVTPCNDVSNGGTADKPWPGLALICASTTDGSKQLFVRTAIFLSDSHADNVTLFDGSTSVMLGRSVYDLGTVKAADVRQFSVRISDFQQNPMPSGSTVSISNMVNGSATILPTSVQNIFPHNTAGVDDRTGSNIQGNQGSWHAVTINSLTPTSCTIPLTSTFNVTVTTPLGNTTSYPFKLAFSCP
ncbi:Ig-like domain-containing protein [Janthinobacterium tructae]|uniref:Ig-like domain-containing protein n=1 Tax=Janthinobacterium tructae TaxID=2590869 RepID=UPI00249B35AA|nr:Ig-like domain-containing protein [Janthinobacterium tructae]MDI3295156.1 Ig-like domain-containing protein [Janthinobacterium tructae]